MLLFAAFIVVIIFFQWLSKNDRKQRSMPRLVGCASVLQNDTDVWLQGTIRNSVSPDKNFSIGPGQQFNASIPFPHIGSVKSVLIKQVNWTNIPVWPTLEFPVDENINGIWHIGTSDGGRKEFSITQQRYPKGTYC